MTGFPKSPAHCLCRRKYSVDQRATVMSARHRISKKSISTRHANKGRHVSAVRDRQCLVIYHRCHDPGSEAVVDDLRNESVCKCDAGYQPAEGVEGSVSTALRKIVTYIQRGHESIDAPMIFVCSEGPNVKKACRASMIRTRTPNMHKIQAVIITLNLTLSSNM
eukprot:763100-Hanusia_phi.AAC.5